MAFMRVIAKEYGRYGIRANSVYPGPVVHNPTNWRASLRQQDIGIGARGGQYHEWHTVASPIGGD